MVCDSSRRRNDDGKASGREAVVWWSGHSSVGMVSTIQLMIGSTRTEVRCVADLAFDPWHSLAVRPLKKITAIVAEQETGEDHIVCKEIENVSVKIGD